MNTNTQNFFELHVKLINHHLEKLILETDVPYINLFKAARYSLLGSGKRLRPILTLATVEMLNGSIQKALTPACAIELIHTYSMIHDDLPCMDDDDFRRGKATLHKVFPEGHAVLTGDYLLTHAFQILAESPFLNGEQKIRLISALAKGAGGDGMIAGQVMDLESEGKAVDLATLQLLHDKKTGALITTSVEFGGIISGASEQEMKLLNQFGKEIGLAYQIVDDILDITYCKEKHGKAISSDIKNAKTTYVSSLGVEQALIQAQALHRSSIDILHKLSPNPSSLIQLATLMINRKK